MIHHEDIIPFTGLHALAEGIVIFRALQAFIGDTYIRVFLHETGNDFFNNNHIFRFIFISKKSNCHRFFLGFPVIHHLVPGSTA